MLNIDNIVIKKIKIPKYQIYFFDDFIKKNVLNGYQCGLIGQRGRAGKNKKYIDEALYLDTETSHNHDRKNPIGWIYQWAFVFYNFIVYGRRPSELIQALKYIEGSLSLYTERDEVTGEVTGFKLLKVFVHNLSYDFQFLKEYLKEAYPNMKLLNTNFHSVLEATTDAFKFKCTYLLTGLSLADWCDRMQPEHGKLSGTVDHSKIYYQNTRLKRENWLYMFYDVLSLKECTIIHNDLNGDTLATMPPTKTAYVRRLISREYGRLPGGVRQRLTQESSIDICLHSLLKVSFAGGYAHANRFYRDRTAQGNIKHRDFNSHYISQMLLKKYPTGKFNKCSNKIGIKEIIENSDKYGFLTLFEFKNVELLDHNITMPYLQESHIFKKSDGFHAVYDNGRILRTYGSFQVAFTEIDLIIFLSQYKPEGVRILLNYRSKKSYLPQYLTDPINSLFLEKMTMKQKLEENKKEGIEDLRLAADYQRIKELLNAIFGMLATNPIRKKFDFDFESEKWIREVPGVEERHEKLELLSKDLSARNFNRFQFGVWVTAYSRFELFKIFRIIGYENLLYSDSDSAFYFSNDEIEKRLNAYNDEIIKSCINRNLTITINNKKYYYGTFDEEPEEIHQFRSLHSKCYGFIYSNEKVKNKLKVTIAGVSKYTYVDGKLYTREEELGSLDNLKDGFKFKKCGSNSKLYVDGKPRTVEVDGHKINTSSFIILTPVEKTLNSQDAFERENYAMAHLG